MRLLRLNSQGEFSLTKDFLEDTPPYAILSHTWGEDEDEVTFNDLENGLGVEKAGYIKLLFCAKQTRRDGLEYFWVDTCCINKANLVELSEAIASMFRWYRDAKHCYVFLSDVLTEKGSRTQLQHAWEPQFPRSRWFTRGWTLQELIAPRSVKFFSREEQFLGDKNTLKLLIQETTGLPASALSCGALEQFPTEERLRWAAKRNTRRKEDKAYCLLGIFDVFIPLLYGEGDYAFVRLKEEIEKRSVKSVPSNKNRKYNFRMGIPTRSNPARDVLDFQGFLRSLSYPEMESRYYNIDDVQDETCRWLLDHRHYREWCNRSAPSNLLMIRGKPGSGKSTALKRACLLARESSHAKELTVAFFFNSRGVPMETKLEGLFRSVLHQLYQSPYFTGDEAFGEWKRKSSSIRSGWTWTPKELQAMFERCITRSAVQITMFVDALDECESTDAARDLMDLLAQLNQGFTECQRKWRICVSSRHYPDVSIAEPLQITVEETNKFDIMEYSMKILGPLVAGSTELSRKIAACSQGIFLWAIFVLDKVRAAVEDGETQTTVYSIIDIVPQRLEDLFRELIDSTPVQEREQRNRIVSWVLFAQRPLSLAELAHALAFSVAYPTYLEYERSRDYIQPGNMRKLLAKRTHGLVEAVESQERNGDDLEGPSSYRVQFIHESVRQCILSQPNVVFFDIGTWESIASFAHNALAQSCINYLKAACAETEVIDAIIEQSSPFRHSSFPSLRGHTHGRHFLDYATEFGFRHAQMAEASGIPQSYLFKEMTSGSSGDTSWWIPFTKLFRLSAPKYGYIVRTDGIQRWYDHIATPLAFACAFHLDSWVQYVLTHSQPALSEQHLSEALCVASIAGNSEAVASLIRTGANINFEHPMLGSPLSSSLVYHQDDILATLLKHDANVHMGLRKHSPLVIATLYSSIEVISSLLARDVSLAERCSRTTAPFNCMSSLGMHALEAAVRREADVMKIILDAAEHQKLGFEYYHSAILAAQTRLESRYVESLRWALTRSSPGFYKPMTIIVRTPSTRTYELEVWSHFQVSHLKNLILDRVGFRLDSYMLSCNFKILRDDMRLSDYNIQQESIIYILPRARWQGINVSGG